MGRGLVGNEDEDGGPFKNPNSKNDLRMDISSVWIFSAVVSQ
jgi:hypothetical protein